MGWVELGDELDFHLRYSLFGWPIALVNLGTTLSHNGNISVSNISYAQSLILEAVILLLLAIYFVKPPRITELI